MNPKKTASGSYHVTAYIGKVDGKPKYKSFTAPTKRECILKATEYINHHKTPSKDMTIETAIDLYIESKKAVLSPSTIKGYHSLQKLYYEPIKGLKIDAFENYDFQRFISGLHLSPKTVRNIYGLLISALKMFSNKRYSITLPDKIEPKRTVATQEDIQKLLAEADPELKKAIILGSCSLRRGEVCALKYEDIEGNTLHVHADMVLTDNNSFVYKDSAKTPSGTRYVQVSPEVIKALGKGSGFIVKVKNPNCITKNFTTIRNRLGIDVSFHSLRRSYASICHSLGIPNAFIMAQGGWKSEQVMIQSYRHTLSDKEKDYVDKFSQEFTSKIIV